MFYNHKRWLAPDMSRKRNVLLFYCSTRTLGAKEATHSAVGAGDQAHVPDDRGLGTGHACPNTVIVALDALWHPSLTSQGRDHHTLRLL